MTLKTSAQAILPQDRAGRTSRFIFLAASTRTEDRSRRFRLQRHFVGPVLPGIRLGNTHSRVSGALVAYPGISFFQELLRAIVIAQFLLVHRRHEGERWGPAAGVEQLGGFR